MADRLRYQFQRSQERSTVRFVSKVSPCGEVSPQPQRRTLPAVAAVPSMTGIAGFILAGASLLASSTTWAADDGATLPIAAYLTEQLGGDRGASVSDMLVQFPVRTPGMQTALLPQRARLSHPYPSWLSQPMALVADDMPSRAWLQMQAPALQAMNVTVLVVQVQSKDHLRALRAQWPNLPMSASELPGSLVQSLGLVQSAVTPLVILADGTLVQDLRPAMVGLGLAQSLKGAP